jgi:gluconokinase
MSQGIPLTDADRFPWLEQVSMEARKQAAVKGTSVVACSALRRSYRDILNKAGDVRYVHLAGSFELIEARVNSREGHFMPPSLLESQFATLEDPANEPGVATVDIDQTPEQIVASAVAQLSL